MSWSFIDVKTTDPAFNLALEQYAFDNLPRDRCWFLLWQNHNTIVIGRHQNTLAEINEEAVRARGITVVRRLSGGGAVYHDLGNLNFTFIQDAARGGQLDMGLFCRPVAQALRAMGVEARVNGRNDITIDGQKFSGNSQYVGGPGRARVTTVRAHMDPPLPLAQFKARLLEEISLERPMEPYALTSDDIAAVEAIKQSRYDRWEWNYGVSPPCDLLRRRRVEGCGLVEAHIRLVDGWVAGIAFFGDFFSAAEPQELAALLRGCPLREEDLRRRLEGADVSRYFAGLTGDTLADILLDL